MADLRKKVFIQTVDALFKAYPMNVPTDAVDFFEDYQKSSSGPKEMTEKGYTILLQMKDVNDWITAKSLGEIMDISGKSVSGTMRKLVTDGFVEKRAGNPTCYKITEKGLKYEIKED